jgi:hypothetical protein
VEPRDRSGLDDPGQVQPPVGLQQKLDVALDGCAEAVGQRRRIIGEQGIEGVARGARIGR